MSKIKFPIIAGALIRGQIKSHLKDYAWSRGYDIDISEDKGVFDSHLRITLDVPDNAEPSVKKELTSWLNKMNEEV